MLIELKEGSKDSKDKQRLPVLKETLRQMGLEYRRDGIDYIGTGGDE